MIVLVCGGRDYGNFEVVRLTLDQIHAESPITLIIHGGATGADECADRWAHLYADIQVQAYPAMWSTHGNAAGPIRNKQMLDDGKPDLVVAFAGGRGTADMVRQARAAGVRVVEVEP